MWVKTYFHSHTELVVHGIEVHQVADVGVRVLYEEVNLLLQLGLLHSLFVLLHDLQSDLHPTLVLRDIH